MPRPDNEYSRLISLAPINVSISKMRGSVESLIEVG